MTIFTALCFTLSVTACSPIGGRTIIRANPAFDLRLEAKRAGFDDADAVVQIFRTASGLVFSDCFNPGPAAMFGVPPEEAQKLADTLKAGEFREISGWTAFGINGGADEWLTFVYKGMTALIDGDTVGTGNIIAARDEKGQPAYRADAAVLAPGAVLFIDRTGRLTPLTLESMADVKAARAEGLPFAVVPAANPLVVFETDKGNVTVELFEDAAPKYVASLLRLAGEGYWGKDCVFYRVCPYTERDGGKLLKLAQVGNPNLRPAMTLPLEPNKLPHKRGTVAAVVENGAPVAGHVFFNLSEREVLSWPAEYPVIGKVIEDNRFAPRVTPTERAPEAPPAGLAVLDELRPGDKLKSVRVLRQRKRWYYPDG